MEDYKKETTESDAADPWVLVQCQEFYPDIFLSTWRRTPLLFFNSLRRLLCCLACEKNAFYRYIFFFNRWGPSYSISNDSHTFQFWLVIPARPATAFGTDLFIERFYSFSPLVFFPLYFFCGPRLLWSTKSPFPFSSRLEKKKLLLACIYFYMIFSMERIEEGEGPPSFSLTQHQPQSGHPVNLNYCYNEKEKGKGCHSEENERGEKKKNNFTFRRDLYESWFRENGRWNVNSPKVLFLNETFPTLCKRGLEGYKPNISPSLSLSSYLCLKKCDRLI